jgi:hypothetical protein
MMHADARLCTATRRDGQPCAAPALPSSSEQRCFAHDPERQAALKASRTAGGHARSTTARASKYLPSHLRQMETRLLDVVDQLGDGSIEPDIARAIVAAVGRLLDLSRYALETGETAELAARVSELERDRARGWAS